MKNILRLIGVFAVVGWLGLAIAGGVGEETGLRTAREVGVERGLAAGEHVFIGERLPAGFYEKIFERLYATKGTDTAREKNLTDSPSDDRDAAWSPAGDVIIFSSNGVDSNNDGQLEPNPVPAQANHNLWTMRADGSQLRQVTNDAGNETEPAWSPLGNRIAFISDRTGQPQVFVKDMASGQEVQVTAGAEGAPGNKAHPAFGTLGVVFASDRNGNWDLWFVRPDGIGLTQLTYDTADDIQPAFAWDNLTVAFSSNRTGTYRIYTIPSENGTLPEAQRMTEPGLYQRTSGGGTVNDTDPSFRPVDQSLFFTSDRPVGGSGNDKNVWRGSQSLNLTGPAIWDASPVLVENFRADDQAADENATCSRVDTGLAENPSEPYRIIFQSDRTGNRDLWSIIPEQDDVEPPRLMSLPTETPKVAAAGVPVTIRVRVEDNFDEWHTVVDMGTYNLATGAFADGSAIQPPPPNDAVDLEGLVLEGLNGTCSVTVTGVNQGDVAGRTWTGVADNLALGARFSLAPTNPGDLCKDVTNIQVSGTATAGSFSARAFRDRVDPTLRGTETVEAVFRVPLEFAGTAYGTQRVQMHTDHPPRHPVTDTNILLDALQPRYYQAAAPEGGRIDLLDDGVGADAVALDGVYSGTWTPPRDIDYFLDIEVQDRAGNSFTYDNVGGFSRRIFNPSASPAILLVLDWTEGQRWTAFEVGPSYSSVPTEMHWTGGYGNPPTVIIAGDPDDTPPGEESAPNIFDPMNWTVWDDNHLDNQWGSWVPRDIWRTQCRGPLPRTLLAAYVARVQMQPNPTDPLLRPTRPVGHAQSCVIWAAPYAGDEWVQPGTILDMETQNNLTWFVENGGRLWVSGEDVAWALTADGVVANPLLSSVLYARYVDDVSPVSTLVGAGPLATDPAWGNAAWPDPVGPPTTPSEPWPYDPPTVLYIGADAARNSSWGDDALWPTWSDVVSPIAPAATHYVYQMPGVGPQGAAGTYVERIGQTGLKTRTVFFSFGLEALHRRYIEKNHRPPGALITTSYEYCRNYRGKVWHDVICWLCDWRLTGRVIHNQGLFPMPKVLILADPVIGADGKPTLQAPYTGITSEDGTFQIEGLSAGGHTFWVYAPGFFWHFYAVGGTVHGQEDVSGGDYKLTEAEPGGVSGTVTAAGTGTPINGATVTATLIGYYLGEPLQAQVQTDANGYYEILRLPTGFYNVSATAPNYGTDTVEQVRVDPGVIKRDVNLSLPAAPGSLSGTVTDAATGNPIQNAVIEAVAGGQVTGTATTGADGRYEIAQIVAGTHQVTASAPGYSALTKAVMIEPAQAKVVNFALSTTPGGSVSGVVRETATGLPSAGATVRVFLGQQEVASAITAGELTTEGTYSFNYRLAVPAGTFQVNVSKANRRALPEFRSVTVVSQQETQSVNFDLEALHSFATGVSLISFPYEYAGAAADPATVLGLTEAELTGSMAYWDGTAYVLYPTAPMNVLVLGRGYFLRLPQPAVVEVEGTQTASDPFVIPLRAGWNMIGDPFLAAVDWYSVQVRSGGTVYSLVDALAAGLIRGRLWSFDGTQYRITLFMSPWAGHWVQAGQDVELLLPAPARGARGVERGERVVEDGWGFGLLAGVGEAMDGVYLGSSPAGREGYDVLDAVQPPAAVGEGLIDIFFDKSAWGSESGRYGVEVRGEVSSGRKRWEFEVETGARQASVFLAWPDLKEVPAEIALTLEDLDTGQRQDMRRTTTYQFNSGSGEARHFAVVAERRSIGSLAVTGLLVSKQGRARVQNISFTLSQPGWVTVEVLNLAGETIRLVKSEEAMVAGVNEVVWDGKNEQGTWAPNGSYVCEVIAKNEAGEVVNVFRTFVVVW